MSRTPRRVERFLRLMTDPSERDVVLGDMEEEFRRRIGETGEAAARRWYRRQAVVSVMPMVGCRIRRLFNRVVTGRHRSQRRRHFAMDDLRRDVIFAIRSLVRRPGFATAAVLTLAIGIGANTAIFSIVNGVLFKGVPGVRSDGLVNISRALDGDYYDVSWPVIEHLARSSQTMDEIAGIFLVPLAISSSSADNPSLHLSAAVSHNYLATLGLRPQLGRFFGRDEDYPTPADVSVISHNLWQSRFSGDSNVLGGVLNVNGYPTRIIGVTPDGFNGPVVGVRLDVYVPLGLQAPALPESSSLSRWNSAQVEAIGRLSRDQSPVTARSELTRLATDFVSAFDNEGDSRAAHAVHVETWSPVPPTIRAGVALFFSVLMATVGVLLGMACLSVTNMLLSMSVERRREFSIRLAMGASRRRLVRQLLTEGAVLFAVAGVAGAVLAAWASRVLLSFQPPLPPGFVVDLNVGIDWRVLVYCAVIAAVSCVAFSLAPAFRATRLDIVSALRNDSGGAGGTRFRSVMITVQMAGTLVLLVGAGLFARALHAMESLDPGWNADRVYVAELDMNLVGMPQDRGAIFFRELLERVRAIPGVEAASLAAKLPLAGSSSLGGVNVQGVDPPNSFGFNASLNRVSDEYFRSVDLQIIQGRDFAADIDGANRVAVINEAMAARLWPAGEAVGESFLLGDVASGVSFEVIGVVENAKYRRLVEETPNFYYLSHQQFYNDQMVLHMKIAEGSVATTAAQLRTVTRELAPNLATPDFRELDGVLGVFLLPQRIGAFVAGVMGVIGLLLGVVGVYGVTSFLMGQRRREIGVRIALGGQQGRVVRGLMARGLIAPAAGIGIGLVLAMGFARLAGSFLGVVSPVDPLTFGSVVLVLSLAAALATFLPTARAVGAAPVAVLKDR